MYTIDASVWTNGADTIEPGHQVSRQLLDILRVRALPIIVPTLLLAEVAGAMSRTRGDSVRAQALIVLVAAMPGMQLIALTRDLADQAAALASSLRLRGADAVYGAVAQAAGTTLISLDREQPTRLAGIVPVQTPAEALAALMP